MSTGTVECCHRARVSDFCSSRSPRNTLLFVNPVEGWWVSMDVVHPRCAGIDCSKKDAKVCIRIRGQGRRRASSTVTTWGATTSQILALREHLIAAKVTCVVIESTSDYWKPVLLSARRRARCDAGERVPGAQCTRPQDRCVRRLEALGYV